AARWLIRHGIGALFVPEADAAEAALAGGLRIYPSPSLSSVMAHLTGDTLLEPYSGKSPVPTHIDPSPEHDLAEVQGQDSARRALEVAASGGHNLLMTGPPGAGKTMLARSLPGLLPPLELQEALELAQIRSVLGDLTAGRPLEWVRPFRAPHHSVSLAGLIGGGARLAPPRGTRRAPHGVPVCC